MEVKLKEYIAKTLDAMKSEGKSGQIDFDVGLGAIDADGDMTVWNSSPNRVKFKIETRWKKH